MFTQVLALVLVLLGSHMLDRLLRVDFVQIIHLEEDNKHRDRRPTGARAAIRGNKITIVVNKHMLRLDSISFYILSNSVK